jgi:hypothetical protein
MTRSAPMPMCPMAETSMAIMERPVAGLMMVVPGIIFLALGVLILLWPSVLPWLVATASILAGGAMLVMAYVMRGIGARLRRAGAGMR